MQPLSTPTVRNAPNIPPEQQSDSAGKPKESAAQPPNIAASATTNEPTHVATNLARDAAGNRDQSADDASEFWVWFGHKVKITDSLLVAVTFLLFLVTGALIFVGVDQAVQLRATIRKIDEVGRVHAGHMAASATAMGNAASAMDKQATLAHQSYLATHRPRLTVRFINCGEPEAGYRPGAEIRIANVGYTDAKIVSIGSDIFRRTNKRIVPGGWSAIPQTVPLNPLAEPSQELVFSVLGGSPLATEHVHRIVGGQDELCLIGIVTYEDHNATKRTTSFFRIYDPSARRYVRAGKDDAHADYEYEN